MRRDYRYLRRMDPDAAFALLAERVAPPDPPPEEEVAVEDAAGRVSARAVRAAVSSPCYHAAAMDGFAVRSQATAGASDARPLRLPVGPDGPAVPIDTGDALPGDRDAVVMVEHTHEPEDGAIEIDREAAPWQHVRLCGEDVVAGEVVLPRGTRITPYDVGALLAAGVTRVPVRRRPRVALIPTGDELIEPGEPVRPGAVIEFNTRMLAALVREWGGEPQRRAAVPDDPDAIEAALREALAACEIVVINAGSSAGRGDHTARVIERAGELCAHGVNVMPGKPTALGVCGGKPVLGLPGYPVSTAVAGDLFLAPLIARWLGVAPARRERVRARLSRKLPSKVGHEEVLRVQVGSVGGRFTVTPLARGAGVISSLSRAGGIVRVPAGAEGLERDAEVEVELLVPRAEVEGTIVHVGSHDLSLDVLDDLVRAAHPGRALRSASAGSLGGLVALGRGECHVAGTHLLDPETGAYNAPWVARYLPGRRVALVHLCTREQGLLVAPGNPRGIASIEDLARPDLRFVNRQRGAGTRVLLDARLSAAGIDPAAVRGYDREEHTHMAVAVAVQSGVADCGLGIRAAAQALGLGFLPLEREPYELAVLAEHLDTVAPLLEIVRSAAFARGAEALGGYYASRRGEVRWVEP